MPVLRRMVLVLSCLMLLPASAYAQSAIAGVVRDASGAVLPGVSVEVASPVLIEKARSTASDGTGQYRITDLVPGTYSVTFVLSRFATTKREGVELNGSGVTTINVEMRVGGVAETVNV